MQWGIATALWGVALFAAMTANAASIASVSPQGEVAQVRQVTVKFSEPVVPLGDLSLPDPMTLACEGDVPSGAGRWANARIWLYDFREPLPPGTRCTLTLRPDWKPQVAAASAASAGIGRGATVYHFNTGGPAIVSVQPYEGGEIEEGQYFLLRLNGAAVERTVLEHAWCEVEGIGEKLGVRVIGGTERAQLLEARHIDKPREVERTLVLACQRPLPNGAEVHLVWGRGIAAAANPSVTTSVEQRQRFTVRDAFTAGFSCQREHANAPCLPVRPMSVSFSAPVARAIAAQVRLEPANGAARAPTFDKDDHAAWVTEITFPAPLPANTAFTVVLPNDLRDDAGRVLSNADAFPLKTATGDAPPIAKFAAAPFGVIELADAMLPVTLRHVQSELRPATKTATGGPGSASRGQVRVMRVDSDADILAWYAKLRKYHETSFSARELGRPQVEWYVQEDGIDAKGRPIKRRVERRIGSREVSLLEGEAGARQLDLPQLAGGDPRPFEVVGIPLPEPGYHVVEIESAVLGRALLDKVAPMYVRTGVLVTNLGVHFKLGRENSVVWVTSLDRGQPVEGAQVAVNDCNGHRLWAGRTDAKGLARIAQPLVNAPRQCVADDAFVVTARKAGGTADVKASGEASAHTDVAFVFSDWQKGIEGWRFNVSTASGSTLDARATTVFDRSLFRAGETVSMKHFFRLETSGGLANAGAADLPTRLKIVHRGSGQEFVQPLAWRGVRSAVSSWNIPPAAKLGVYDVVLEREAGTGRRPTSWTSGNFRVEEFRTPLVDARLSGPKAAVIAPSEVAVAVQLNYFSGGGLSLVDARASALLKSRPASFAGYDEFSFDPPRDLDQWRGGNLDEDEDASEPDTADAKLVADKLALTTDRHGAASFTLAALPKITRPSVIDAELTFNDPNGEVQTVATSIPVWPSAVVLGVKTGSWASERGRVKFKVLALDTAGKVLAGQKVEVRGRVSRTLSTRKRMVGGFYAYDNRTEVEDLGPLCSGATDDHGLLACEADLDAAGQVELIASARDASGNPAQAAASVWVTRQGELWFAQDNDDRIDVLPEKKRYEPGETARLQVRMPYREATALVAVEREGVIETRVVTLRGDDPTIELKIDKNWAPNVYVSVLALRGRIRATPWYSLFTWGWKEPLHWARSFWYAGREYQAPTAMIDLAKPSFKLGVAKLRVGLAAHELQVSVTSDKPVYAVRETAKAHIRVSFEGKPMAGAEVAFAAVDEGLLALRDNRSWDLLHAMIRERAWGVSTSTAQGEIIGRRHYGRKAVPSGGGGGHSATRELFDTLLVWKATVALDANGEAVVEVPLNDSLTSFRLVAVADAGAQQFGTGSTSIKVTQDLQLLSGLPPLVRDGDRFSAMLTLRNTTEREMKVRASLHGTVNRPGAGASPDIVHTPLDFPPQDVTVAAGAATELVWPIEVPADAFSLRWEAAAEEQGSAKARDRLAFTQLVAPAVPVQVIQATLEQLEGKVSWPVAAPAAALPASGVKRGGLRVAVQPRLTGALPGLRRYFERYPYSCLEQRASIAVGLKDATRWAAIANALPTYLDRDGLASYFPPRPGDAARGSDTLTAYLLAITHEAGFELPPAARDAMLKGLSAFVEGRIERRFWSPASAQSTERDVRKLAAIGALARYGRAEARMLGSINIAPNTWPTAAVIDWLGILERVPGIARQAQRLEEANQILRSRLTYAGTTLRFSNEESDFWWWLMDSADANAAKLILAVLDDPAWRDDLPRMVVGSLSRQRHGAWLTTTANLWGTLALDKFAARFESESVSGKTVASLGDARASVDWSHHAEGGAVQLTWPAQPGVMNVVQEGSGKPWVTLQAIAAVPLTAPVRAGYSISRSVTAVERKDPARIADGTWSRGDVLRVRLEIDAQSDMTWVVVSDPVPGGATILGSGLGRDSQIATRTERRSGNAWPAFEERGFEAFRAYYEYLPRGKHVIEYSVRLNNPGRFALPPTRVEALYAPESFGATPNAALVVEP
jgi:uncharacterized protein YfaS (alpha-2-macroglobulin family)